MNYRILAMSVLLAGLWLGGCKEEGRYSESIDIKGVYTLQNGLVVHDAGRDRLVFLEPTSDTVAVREFYRAADGEDLDWSMVGPNPSEPTAFYQMILPADKRNPDVVETLVRFAFDGAEATESRYVLQSAFSSMVFDPGAAFAVLYHSEEGEDDNDIFNPNEVAILRLDEGPSDTNPTILSVELNGHRVTGVTYLPPLKVGSVTRQFVVFMAEGVVRLMDLLDPTATARIQLVTDTDPRSVVPHQVIARDADEIRNPMVFIRASGSEDIYAITVGPKPDGESGFMATMNQFEAHGQPLDMVTVQDGEDPLLVVLSRGSGQNSRSIFNVVDIDTSSPFTIFTDDKADTLVKREIASGEQLVAFGDNTTRVSFLEVDGLSEEKDHNHEDVEVPDGIANGLLLDEGRLLILSEMFQDIILLDLETQRSTRFSAPSLDFDDWVTSQIYNEWFYFVPGSGDRVGYVSLETDHPDSLLLDDSVTSFHIVKASDLGVCMHSADVGRVTVFPLSDPTRASAFVVDGLWLSNFLSETEVSE